MRNKSIILLVIILSLTINVTSVNASIDKSNETKSKSIEKFLGCYIEASGEIDFTWQLTDFPIGFGRELILYWPIVFIEPNVDITIYSKKNGEIFWQNPVDSGQMTLHLIGFRGIYNNDGSTTENLIANLNGRAILIIIYGEKIII